MKNMEVEINVLGFESDGIGSLLDEWHFGCNKTYTYDLVESPSLHSNHEWMPLWLNKTYTYALDESPNLHSNHVAR